MYRYVRGMFIPSLLLFGSLSLSLYGQPATATIDGINARQIEGHIRFLASDLLEGRDTASVGERLAASYISNQLSRIGFEPAGDLHDGERSWFQAFPMYATTAHLAGCTLDIEMRNARGESATRLSLGTDFFVSTRGLEPGLRSGDVVFAGHGIVSPEHGIDDYKNLSVEGSFVLILDGKPEGLETGDGERESRQFWMRTRQGVAQQRGALGVLVIHGAGADQAPFAERMSGSMRSFGRRSISSRGRETRIPLIYLEDSVQDQPGLDGLAKLNSKTRHRKIRSMSASFNINIDKGEVDAFNVVSLLPGSDPELSNEVVVYSAHYDHLGVGSDGEIYNGADDNASGSSALIEIAEAFSEGPRPARSILILHVSGEEKGLLGSAWFVDHNPLPGKMKIVADINLDMVSRNDPDKIGITPSPEHKHWSTLNVSAARACAEEGLEPTYDVDRFYGRTDSYNFAKIGIPAIFFFAGVHDDYHRASDESHTVNFSKAAAVSRVAYRLGWQVAMAKEPPVRQPHEPPQGN